MKDKILIFDASTIISFAMAGMLEEFKELRKIFLGKFIITREVKAELIDKPITNKRYELEALKIQELINEKILELPESLDISDYQIEEKAQEILDISNATFFAKGKPIHIIDLGEASCLALSEILLRKQIGNVCLIDERTTRVLCEKPDNLRRILENKLHTRIDSRKINYSRFENFAILRSCDLAYIIYKKRLIKITDQRILDAMLWGLKLNGCSINEEEIAEIKYRAG